MILIKKSFPHSLTLLVLFILISMILSHLIPSGVYDRQTDEQTGREIVISGSYHEIPPSLVGFFDAIVAISKGMIAASDIIFPVFLIGGAFTVVDQTHALKKGVSWLTILFHGKKSIIIILVSIAFATGGALEYMQEEIIALIPVLLILTNRLGFKPMVAVSMSAGSAFVASSFSPINPFQVRIAQKLAQIPLLSGGWLQKCFPFNCHQFLDIPDHTLCLQNTNGSCFGEHDPTDRSLDVRSYHSGNGGTHICCDC